MNPQCLPDVVIEPYLECDDVVVHVPWPLVVVGDFEIKGIYYFPGKNAILCLMRSDEFPCARIHG